MKGFLLLLFGSAFALRAEVIAQWNFNSLFPDATVSTGSSSPSAGTGAAAVVGNVTGSFASGDTAHDPAATDNSGWSTTGYPATAGLNQSGGVRFDVSTADYEGLTVSWYQRNSSTASRYARFQYTVDGGNFVDAKVITLSSDSVFTYQSVDLSSVSTANDNPIFGFRIVTEWESSATGAGVEGFVATKTGSTYSPGGTIRFDMVTVMGSLRPGANHPPVITAPPPQTVRSSRPSPPIQFSILDAEDPAASLGVYATSSDPSILPESAIVFGGESSSRTLTLTPAQPGSVLVTIFVTDLGGKTTSATMPVTVLQGNASPYISSIAATSMVVYAAAPVVPFEIGDLETPAQNLALAVSSENPLLVPDSSLGLSGSGSNRFVSITPVPGQLGIAPITISVTDGTNFTTTRFALAVLPSPSVVFRDEFEYPDGPVISRSGQLWSTRSGTPEECVVQDRQLQINSTLTEDVIAPLFGGPFNTNLHTVLYAAFQLSAAGLPRRTPEYFAHFTSGNTLCGRVCVSTPSNAPPGQFRLGVANYTGTPVELNRDLLTNHTYLIVTRFDIDQGATSLGVDPASESDLLARATDAFDPVKISGFAFREDSGLGTTLLIDNLRIGLTFGAVISTNVPPRLQFGRANMNRLVLAWDGPARLQKGPRPEGVFTNVAGTSPYTATATGAPAFFRLEQP